MAIYKLNSDSLNPLDAA